MHSTPIDIDNITLISCRLYSLHKTRLNKVFSYKHDKAVNRWCRFTLIGHPACKLYTYTYRLFVSPVVCVCVCCGDTRWKRVSCLLCVVYCMYICYRVKHRVSMATSTSPIVYVYIEVWVYRCVCLFRAVLEKERKLYSYIHIYL